VLESLTDYISSSRWTYAFLFAISALDVIFPIVPSETAVIIAGVLAGQGDLVIWVVIPCAALGAILGDNVSYLIGRFAGERIVERYFKGERRKRIDWAERQMEDRGPYLIVVGRFIPGGRTAVTLSAGLLEMPWRKFIFFDVIAGFAWASYASLLGYFGGKTFEESPLKAFGIAFAIALAVSGIIELYRWYRKRRALEPS
jgi:membrane protein DedA with SNARE-associated domain